LFLFYLINNSYRFLSPLLLPIIVSQVTRSDKPISSFPAFY
jgi:hypothetical protein